MDEFMLFRCAKCPSFEPESCREWDSHFYKSYEWCKTSWKAEAGKKAIVKSLLFFKNIAKNITGFSVNFPADPVIPEEELGLPDLRRLTCKACQTEIIGSKFQAMAEHLEKVHSCKEKSTLTGSPPGEDNLEQKVSFGCLNCPMFKPPSTSKYVRVRAKSSALIGL